MFYGYGYYCGGPLAKTNGENQKGKTAMSKLDKQTAKLIGRIAENLPEMDGDIMQGWIDNPKGLQKFLRGLCPPEATAPKEEAPLDTIIRVDRSVRPVYPDWAKVVMHPELEAVGPAEYDLAKVELYLHDEQKDGKWMKGTKLYDHLKETDSLKNCLGLHDALEIQKKGIKVFRKLFGGKAVFCWKSVVRSRDGDLFVPCVCVGGSLVVVSWDWLGHGWYDVDPAARFAS